MTKPEDTAILEELKQFNEASEKLRTEVEKVIVGQREVVDQLLIALFSGGHCLLVGVPGLAKTLLISTVARALELEFSRIQFTPDLMPSDITGTEILEEEAGTGGLDDDTEEEEAQVRGQANAQGAQA